MRLVCKAWYDFVSYLEQRGELCIYEKKVPHKLKWSTDGAEVRWTVKIETSKLDLSKDPFVKGLKKFYVYVIYKSGLLEPLNNLTNLEELVFNCPIVCESLPAKLNLPNLKTLTFKNTNLKIV